MDRPAGAVAPGSAVLARRRLRPFAGSLVVATALLALSGTVEWPLALAAVGGIAALLSLGVLVPRLALGPHQAGAAVIAIVLVAVLRHATGGAGGGYGVLYVFPVLWVALYAGRRDLLVAFAAVAVALLAPVLLGATAYPSSSARSVVLLLGALATCGLVVQALLASQREVRLRLSQELERSAAVAESMADGLVLVQDWRILEVNPAFCSLLGVERDAVVGTRPPWPFWPDGVPREALRTLARLRDVPRGEVDVELARADGTAFVASVTVTRSTGPGGLPAYVACLRDATERRRAEALREAELRSLAATDPLTGLPNRRALGDRLVTELRDRDPAAPLALAVLDLDHFKRYNDAHGHLAGDRLLLAWVGAWERLLGDGDVVTRWGGEEFAVVLPGRELAEARRHLDRLRDVRPGGETCSAGVAAWAPGLGPDDLLAAADAALYRAKREGRDRTRAADGPPAPPGARAEDPMHDPTATDASTGSAGALVDDRTGPTGSAQAPVRARPEEA